MAGPAQAAAELPAVLAPLMRMEQAGGGALGAPRRRTTAQRHRARKLTRVHNHGVRTGMHMGLPPGLDPASAPSPAPRPGIRMSMTEFMELAQLVKQHYPVLGPMWPAAPRVLLAIEDGHEECEPFLRMDGKTVPLREVAKESVGALYLAAFKPYDAMGNHMCDPSQAVRAMLHICRQVGRIGLAHRLALVRLVRKATTGRYFHFSRSVALLEYMLEIVGDTENSAVDLDWDSDLDRLEEEEDARGQG